MSKFFYLGQYIRHDMNVWYGPQGVRVSDPVSIARLEAEYRNQQRTNARTGRPTSNGVHPPRINPNSGRDVFRTPREPKNNGRPE